MQISLNPKFVGLLLTRKMSEKIYSTINYEQYIPQRKLHFCQKIHRLSVEDVVTFDVNTLLEFD